MTEPSDAAPADPADGGEAEGGDAAEGDTAQDGTAEGGAAEGGDATPLWLLDVDGVLNAVTDADPPTWRRWELSQARGFPIRWSPDALDRITALVQARVVEVRWLTTWSGAITQLPFVAGHGWPLAGEADIEDPDAGWWKLAVARSVHRPGRRMVWTDDDIAVVPAARAWAGAAPGVLAISPDPAVGLTPADLDRVEAHLRG